MMHFLQHLSAVDGCANSDTCLLELSQRLELIGGIYVSSRHVSDPSTEAWKVLNILGIMREAQECRLQHELEIVTKILMMLSGTLTLQLNYLERQCEVNVR